MTVLRTHLRTGAGMACLRRFATIHPRFQTPHLAILMFGAWSALLAITGTYETLAAYAMFAAWVFYGMTSLGVIVCGVHNPSVRVRTFSRATQ